MVSAHYKIGEDLYQFNSKTGIYRKRNTTDWICLNEDEFKALGEARRIKREEFSRLMNIFFKSFKHKWVFNGKNYRKLGNFEDTIYKANEIPRHRIKGYEYLGNLVFVYHWGRVYFFTWSYNGYQQGQLICPKTMRLVRWARAKHCAPIMNIDSKVII